MAFLFDWPTFEADEYTTDTKNGSVVILGKRQYLAIEDSGSDEDENFIENAKNMYLIADYLTKAPENGVEIAGFKNYVHYPLNLNKKVMPDGTVKYWMLMKHPNFMPEKAVYQAINNLKDQLTIDPERIKFIHFEEGTEAQIGNVGEIENNSTVQNKLKEYIDSIPFEVEKDDGWHRELYLDNVTTTPREQWRTILRQKVKDTSSDAFENVTAIRN